MAGRSYQPSLPYRNARKRSHVPAPPTTARRVFRILVGLVVLVVGVNGLIGERGLLASRAARHQHRQLVREVERIRIENDEMRRQAQRLLEDPAAIEEVAKQDLGLIRRGEIVFLLNDTPPTERNRSARAR